MTVFRHFLLWLLCGLTLSVGLHAEALAPAPLPLARDLHEQVVEVNVTVQDMYGRREQRAIPVTVFRPTGVGPFPLLVLNHGRAGTPAERAQPQRFRYEQQARYFVGKGFVVAVPTRVGYGQAQLDGFDPEFNGGCSQPLIGPMSQAASDQVLAVVEQARQWPGVDISRWWVAGQSVGGLTSVAVVLRAPEGLQGGINFSGGTGGNPKDRPGQPCGAMQLARYWQAQAVNARAPMLWAYWENDKFWGAEIPRQWHQAFVQGGGRADWVQFGAISDDGHQGFARDMDRWTPVVDRFLARWGMTQAALPSMPESSGFARIDQVDRVPVSVNQRQDLYGRFLASSSPRAFAIGPSGQAGYAAGDWAVGRALGFCQARTGVTCRLYAVDDQVVWTP
jgi:dienelactone hydrolase